MVGCSTVENLVNSFKLFIYKLLNCYPLLCLFNIVYRDCLLKLVISLLNCGLKLVKT